VVNEAQVTIIIKDGARGIILFMLTTDRHGASLGLIATALLLANVFVIQHFTLVSIIDCNKHKFNRIDSNRLNLFVSNVTVKERSAVAGDMR